MGRGGGGGGGTGDGTWRAAGIANRLADGRAVGGGGKSRPLSLTNRSMAGDTDDGGNAGDGRSPGPGAGFTAGGAGTAGSWAAQGAGPTPARSRTVARIEGQAVLCFITSPVPSGE